MMMMAVFSNRAHWIKTQKVGVAAENNLFSLVSGLGPSRSHGTCAAGK